MEHCDSEAVVAFDTLYTNNHIQILKVAGLLKMRREGTKNYYYFDADMEAMDRLIQMLIHAKEVMERLPDRNGE